MTNSEPAVAPVSAPMPNLKTSIPYPSRRKDERRREKANGALEILPLACLQTFNLNQSFLQSFLAASIVAVVLI
ncbi:hypothetical protein Tco_0992681 [Tanacetum coccineum]|uniref:Uncharacterized protein n=1 Tax=Tanacetum coccineum TaxID=301880 RepID=A0ABQ5F4I3_9ASTR